MLNAEQLSILRESERYICLVAALCTTLGCYAVSARYAHAAADHDAATLQSPKKLALLVGINTYQYQSDLLGAVNDVKNVRRLLVENFGFPDDSDHIRVLVNERATRDAIISSIQEHLIAKATSDTIAIFHYSGHGSQLSDTSGDEIDGWDETIVPYDSSHSDPYPNRDITDDELNSLLTGLTDKTPNATFIFDSCHSGTVVRSAGLPRRVDPDKRPPPPRSFEFSPASRDVGEGKSDLRPGNAMYALISGSAAQELSYELDINGKQYGAMTWFLADQIRQVGTEATYRDVMDLVKARVSSTYFVQHPQLEGPGADQYVFSDRSRVAEHYVLVSPQASDRVSLRAGEVHGVTTGSIYDVYPPDTKSFGRNATLLARIEITDVDVTTAKAKVVEGKVDQEAARAVEREHYWPDAVVKVRFVAANESPILQRVEKELRAFEHVQVIGAEGGGYGMMIREEGRYIVTEGADSVEISPRVSVTDSSAVVRVVEQVTKWAKWRNIRDIRNVNSDLQVDFRVKLPERVRSASDSDFDASLSAGQKFTVEVTNNSQSNLYMSLLDLSSDGSVALVYPTRGQEEFIAPGKTWSKKLVTFVPKDKDSVFDVLKLVATTSPSDFGFLQQDAVREAPPLPGVQNRSRNPLEQLLANAAIGTTRGVAIVNVEDWVTAEQVLEVQR